MSSKLDTLIDWNQQAHRDKLYEFLKDLQDKAYWITIKPYRKNRSREANAYYWVGVVSPIAEFHGYDPQDTAGRDKVHEMLKQKFNSEEIQINRRVFVFELGNGFEEIKEVLSYLEEVDFKPEVVDGKIVLPIRVIKNIPNRFEYGEEIDVVDFMTVPKTTTKLDTVEHYEFIERIRDYYAQEYNLYIPAPDEGERAMSEFDEFYKKEM